MMLFNEWTEQMNGLYSVLVVDDDQFNIMALQYLLETMGILSDSALSGK
jgi:CheY-like chemotaxis protein